MDEVGPVTEDSVAEAAEDALGRGLPHASPHAQLHTAAGVDVELVCTATAQTQPGQPTRCSISSVNPLWIYYREMFGRPVIVAANFARSKNVSP